MPWDPAVLRKYNSTGHFRLLSQLRSDLKDNPLIRPRDGESVGAANRSRSLTRALEQRASQGVGRSRRAAAASTDVTLASSLPDLGIHGPAVGSFRDRLSAIDMR
ncbi:MAG: hypothetical protein VKK62_05935 [Synechococcaceae cyanobacterium]|nr:hypothetical protein [Synechococcaceae cyanobacterium]